MKNLPTQIIFTLLFLVLSLTASSQTTIFSENMGTGASSTTPIASNTFQNSGCPYSFSGSGDVRQTGASSGYTGSSGSDNVFFTSAAGTTFILSGINTTGFTAITLKFGFFKTTIASDGTELTVQYSTDGSTYSPLTFPAQPTGSGTANWRLLTITGGTIPATPNLYLKFTNTSNTPSFRIDDILLTGTPTTPAAPTNPSPYNLAGSNYSFTTWASTNAAGTFPASMAIHYGTANIIDPTLAQVTASEDYNLAYNLSCRTRVNGLGANGLSFLNTNPGYVTTTKGNLGEAVLALNTSNRTNIQVSWTAGTVTAGTSFYKLRAQYRVGTSGSYTDLPNSGISQIEYTSGSSGTSTAFGPITLPPACDNAAVVQIRWVYYYISGSSTRDEIRLDDIAVTSTALVCSSPDSIAFVTQPSNVVQDAAMTTVTVKAFCKSTNVTAASYTGNITLTVSGNGCGYTSQTVAAVAGIATFSNIKFTRSTQAGISLTASASGFNNVVSNPFNVTVPAGTPTTTTLINENFDGSTPTWSYTSSLVTDYTSTGNPVVGLKDYTTNPYGNSTFKKSLVKSHSQNNSGSDGESTNEILFSNISGLSAYNSVKVSFSLGSLPSQSSGASGNGVDANEDLVVETSLDGGTTWSTLLTYYGFSNYLLPLSTSSPVTLSYNANASYNSDHSNSSTQSAFVINLPGGTSQFRMRLTATDNREEENWAIDNISIIGTATPAGTPKSLPTATGSSYSTCPASALAIGVALTNTQGSTSYHWSPSTNISSTTSAGPTVTLSAATNYSVTVTDADGCTASATDAINITTPAGNVILAPSTISAIEPTCPDAAGWTYYTDPTDATKWLLGIYKNGNTFSANVDLTLETSSPTYELKSNSSMKKAVYTMGRYWNVTLATGSINGSSNPVKVRFFYNPADTSAIRSAALTQAQGWGLGASNIHQVEWFKTNTGIIYNPANNTYSDVPNKLNENSYAISYGTMNGLSYVEYDGLQGFSGGSAAVRVSPGAYALPVKLLSLTAVPIDNSYVKLDWSTASEINNYGFDIERSTNGIDFEKLAFMSGHGSSDQEMHYEYRDINVSPDEVYYYRLKQIDNDGKFEYTTLVSALLLSSQGFIMEDLKPNPASNQVIVNTISAGAQEADVKVTDMLGRTQLSQSWTLSPGLNGTQLDISGLPTGSYMVTVKSVNGIFSKRLAVTR